MMQRLREWYCRRKGHNMRFHTDKDAGIVWMHCLRCDRWVQA